MMRNVNPLLHFLFLISGVAGLIYGTVFGIGLWKHLIDGIPTTADVLETKLTARLLIRGD